MTGPELLSALRGASVTERGHLARLTIEVSDNGILVTAHDRLGFTVRAGSSADVRDLARLVAEVTR